MTDHQGSTLTELERDLRDDDRDPELGPHRLADIRSRGRRRRRARHALTTGAVAGLAAAVVIGVVGLGATGGGPGDDAREDLPPADAPRAEGLSDLAQRALTDVPGARQVSATQVVVPSPGERAESGDIPVPTPERLVRRGMPSTRLVGDLVRTGQEAYDGVTDYPRSAFPAWLHDATTHLEQDVLADDDGSYPVGTTESGVLVDAGEAVLGCVSWDDAPCAPAVLLDDGDRLTYEWGFGTDSFLRPGTGMEVFAPDTRPGDAAELTVAGLPDDSVTRVVLVSTDGEQVEGGVSHELAQGSSILWGSVPGQLARVVAYDVDGDVVEDHAVRDCSGGVDCEVR